MSKVYIKKFHGNHFHIDYRETEKIEIVFPKLNNKDRFIFEIIMDVIPTEEELSLFLKKIYSDLENLNENLSIMAKKTSIAEALETINFSERIDNE